MTFKESRKGAGNPNYKHGVSRQNKPIYHAWRSMIDRCENPKYHHYHRYGGRGIKVCSEWRDDVLAFKDWCLANGWLKGLQLDRRDNDGDYTPQNCRWVTCQVNQQNRCNTGITSAEVREIKQMHALGMRNCEIHRATGRRRAHIASITSGIRWSNIQLSAHAEHQTITKS